IFRKFQKHISIGSAAAQHKRAFVFDERRFYFQSGSNKSDATFCNKFFVVTVHHRDVQNRRNPPAELGRNATFIELGIFYGIRVEGRKESHQVGSIVNGGFVQQDEVLV